MSTFTDDLVTNCLAEWGRFEHGAKKETDDPQFKFVGEYWQALGKNMDGRTIVGGIRPAWSSAFVSFVIGKSGAGNKFKYTEAHCHYVDAAMKAADDDASQVGYVARRYEGYSVKVGDIVVAGREYAKRYDYDQARLVYQADSFYPSHGDIVIGVNPGDKTVTAIGGNVTTDTVGRRTYRTKLNGSLEDRKVGGTPAPWVAVLECRL